MIWTSICALKFLCKHMMVDPSPSASLAIPGYRTHYVLCVCVCGCVFRESTGLLLARARVLALKQTVRDWSPSVPLPPLPPLSNYKAACLIFVQGSQPLFLGFTETCTAGLMQSPRSPSAHSYPPIKLLCSLKIQLSHNAMLYDRSSHAYTHTVGFPQLKLYIHITPPFTNTHTHNNECILCCQPTSPATSVYAQSLYIHYWTCI